MTGMSASVPVMPSIWTVSAAANGHTIRAGCTSPASVASDADDHAPATIHGLDALDEHQQSDAGGR